jgi:deazaflavin-dependent oxidoreductase (nitroreductase family)
MVRLSVSAPNDNSVRRFMRWTGSLKPVSLFYARTLHHLDRRVFQLSNGKTTFAAWASGLPIAMLETTGAKSGRKNTLPVVGIPEGEDLIVIASNYGQARHPAWYHNLKAHPRARVTVDGATREMHAFEVTDPAERERLFEQASRQFIVFPAYKKRTDKIGRRIPIIRLKP